MNSKIIIITILILVKVVGVASRAKANYTCGDVVKTSFYFNNSYSDSIYRCGNAKVFNDV